MNNKLEGRDMVTETVAHDLSLEVVHTSIKGFQEGNGYQVSDVDIARYAVAVYKECFPVIRELVDK